MDNFRKKNKKILFFLPTLSTGGGERVVSELSLALPDCFEKTIVLFQKNISYKFSGALEILEIPLANNFFAKIYYFFLAWRRFKKIIKKIKPDYSISFTVPCGVINVLCEKNSLLRVDNVMSKAHGWFYQLLIRFFYRQAKKIICVSKISADDLVQKFGIKPKKIKVIYNPLNLDEIKKLSQEQLTQEEEEIFKAPVIITSGRLSKQKGQWHLIRAFAKIKKEIPQSRIVILGKGEMENNLKKIASDYGLENDVFFLGWQKNPFKFLAKSKVFALSSLWEGLPYSALEAMACGVPVVLDDCQSGPREILAPESSIFHQAHSIEKQNFGILTPAFNEQPWAGPLSTEEELLANALVEVLKDMNFAASLQKKSLKRAEDFGIKNIIKEWDFLYDTTD